MNLARVTLVLLTEEFHSKGPQLNITMLAAGSTALEQHDLSIASLTVNSGKQTLEIRLHMVKRVALEAEKLARFPLLKTGERDL